MAMNIQVVITVIAALTLFTLFVETEGRSARTQRRRISKDIHPNVKETSRGNLPKLSFTVGNDSVSESYIREFYKLLKEESDHGDSSAALDIGLFNIVEGISVGLQRAVEECKYQFKWERWNCPVTTSSVLSKASLNSATRETSFLQAITAAGIMFDVLRTCSHSSSSVCRCGRRARNSQTEEAKDWEWEGCAPNHLLGAKASAIVLGTHGQPRDVMAAVNSHNQQVGQETMVAFSRKCRCIGPTGSCAHKICWMSYTKFRKVGSVLKNMYRSSKRIKSSHPVLQKNKKRDHERFRMIRQNLVHLEKSPDYCLPDISAGTTGTRGRECKMSTNNTGRCRNLCTKCGYEIETVVREETHECDCVFHWCCRVECSSCLRNVSRVFCA